MCDFRNMFPTKYARLFGSDVLRNDDDDDWRLCVGFPFLDLKYSGIWVERLRLCPL
jgi:hypothetical protein